ncbi:hypothetical protein Bbelb_218290 [Branchiostoma belcheri]|nr:hypothetical protein Bbelb_218290 [Branchiostoma belcheri]
MPGSWRQMRHLVSVTRYQPRHRVGSSRQNVDMKDGLYKVSGQVGTSSRSLRNAEFSPDKSPLNGGALWMCQQCESAEVAAVKAGVCRMEMRHKWLQGNMFAPDDLLRMTYMRGCLQGYVNLPHFSPHNPSAGWSLYLRLTKATKTSLFTTNLKSDPYIIHKALRYREEGI